MVRRLARPCDGWRWLQPGWSGGRALAMLIGRPYQSQPWHARRVVARDIGSHRARIIGCQAVQYLMQNLEGKRFLANTGDIHVGIALLAREAREVTIRRQ